ncbi:hypothetical protein [Thioclava sp. GXIMD4216]|uniref:hypothetical protein n=1 Tax=unclassified Thioclava TaxID=2621713 RepID=UPI0030CA5C42
MVFSPVRQIEIDPFSLTLMPMQQEHLGALHGLSVALGWPHRHADWAANLDSGTGIVAVDEAGRVHGSAMTFSYHRDLSAIGMVIAHPKLARTALFRTLATEALEQSTGAAFLNACQQDVSFYRDLGVRSAAPVFRYEGFLPCGFSLARNVRPFRPQDRPRLHQLDQSGYCADRSRLVATLLEQSETYVIETCGHVTGFAMRRRFGRGHVIGPVIAANETDALSLTTSLMAGLAGQFLRLDTRQTEGSFVGFLAALGFRARPDVTTMTTTNLTFSPEIYAISGHSTG